MDKLPSDVVRNVLGPLLTLEDVVALASVCRSTRRALACDDDVRVAASLLRVCGGGVRASDALEGAARSGRPRVLVHVLRRCQLGPDTPTKVAYVIRDLLLAETARPEMSALLVKALCKLREFRPESLLVFATAVGNGVAVAALLNNNNSGAPVERGAARFNACMRDRLDMLQQLGLPGTGLDKLLLHAYRYDARRVIVYLLACGVSPACCLAYEFVEQDTRQFLLDQLSSLSLAACAVPLQ